MNSDFQSLEKNRRQRKLSELYDNDKSSKYNLFKSATLEKIKMIKKRTIINCKNENKIDKDKTTKEKNLREYKKSQNINQNNVAKTHSPNINIIRNATNFANEIIFNNNSKNPPKFKPIPNSGCLNFQSNKSLFNNSRNFDKNISHFYIKKSKPKNLTNYSTKTLPLM